MKEYARMNVNQLFVHRQVYELHTLQRQQRSFSAPLLEAILSGMQTQGRAQKII